MIEAVSLEDIIQEVNCKLPRKVVRKQKETIYPLQLMIPGSSSTPSSYRTVFVEEERYSKLIGILFAHPHAPLAKAEIINHLDLFHHRSGDAVDFFCVGYGAYWSDEYMPDPKTVATIDGVEWLFSTKAFSNVIDEVEKKTTWRFSGETEILLLSAKKDANDEVRFDFGSAIVCNLEAMHKDQAFTSVRSFFEGIFRFAKQNSCADPAWALSDTSGQKVASEALKDSVLSLLPKKLRDSYKKAEHYAIRSIS